MYGDRDDPYGVLARLGRQLEATLVPDTVFSTIVAYLLYYSAVARIEPSKVAAFMYFQPIVASLIAFFIAGEVFSRPFLFGVGLVLTGVLLAEWS